MQKSGSDLGSKHIFAPPSGQRVDESTLNYIGRADSFKYLQEIIDDDPNNRHAEVQTFRNASDSFFKNQVRQRNAQLQYTMSTGHREKQRIERIKEENIIDSDRHVYHNG